MPAEMGRSCHLCVHVHGQIVEATCVRMDMGTYLDEHVVSKIRGAYRRGHKALAREAIAAAGGRTAAAGAYRSSRGAYSSSTAMMAAVMVGLLTNPEVQAGSISTRPIRV